MLSLLAMTRTNLIQSTIVLESGLVRRSPCLSSGDATDKISSLSAAYLKIQMTKPKCQIKFKAQKPKPQVTREKLPYEPYKPDKPYKL